MADRSDKTDSCLVIQRLGKVGSPGHNQGIWLRNEIITPLFQSEFPTFEVYFEDEYQAPGDDGGGGRISYITSADLLIADLSKAAGFHLMEDVGRRHMTRKPIVHLTDDLNSVEEMPANKVILYGPTISAEQIKRELSTEIRHVLNQSLYAAKSAEPISTGHTGARVNELAGRIDEIALAITELRINSLYEHAEKLRALSAELRTPRRSFSPTTLKADSTSALQILTAVYEALGSSHGAKVIIAGAVAGILSIGGWPAVTAYSITLAAWQGKDAFIAAVKRLIMSHD
jgi:hypothetical protein